MVVTVRQKIGDTFKPIIFWFEQHPKTQALFAVFVMWCVYVWIADVIAWQSVRNPGSLFYPQFQNYLPSLYPDITKLPLFARWDSFWYGLIASEGYHVADSWDQGIAGFLPLYPWLMRYSAALFGVDELTAGVWVSRIFFLFAMWLLYLWVQEVTGEKSFDLLMAMVAFPFGFIFVSAYTESVFLFFTVATFYAIRKNAFWLAALAAFLASLTRIHIVALVPTLSLVAILAWRQNKSFRWQTLLPLFGVFAASIFLLIFYEVVRGDPLAYFKAKEAVWHNRLVSPLQVVEDYFYRINIAQQKFGFSKWIVYLELPTFFFLLGASYWLVKRKMLVEATWVVCGVITSLAASTLWCLPRYSLVLFPAYLLITRLKKYPILWHSYLIVGLMMQGILIMNFVLFWRPAP